MSKSLTDMRAEARAAYDTALLDPDNADWQNIAANLASVLPATRKVAVKAPNQYSDYANPKRRSKHLRFDDVAVTFADGEVVNVSVCGDSRKFTNWGPALRCAASFYRTRMAARYHDHTCFYSKHERGLRILTLSNLLEAPKITGAVNTVTEDALDLSTAPQIQTVNTPESIEANLKRWQLGTTEKTKTKKKSKRTRKQKKTLGMGTWQKKRKARKPRKELQAA